MLHSCERDAYTDVDRKLMELLSLHIASAINRVNAQKELAQTREPQYVELIKGVQKV